MRKLTLLLAAILICGLIFGCAPPKPPMPAGGASTPPPTPVPMYDSFTIRVTGKSLAYNEEEGKRRLDLAVKEYMNGLRKTPFLSSNETDDLYTEVPDVEFSGSYMVITSSGGSTSRSVDGTTPSRIYR